jgi:hypothetical protein
VFKRTPASTAQRFAVAAVIGLSLVGATASAAVVRDQGKPRGKAPARAAQGQTYQFSIQLKSTATARCSLLVRYADGALQQGLSVTFAARGHAQWTFKVPETAATGNAKAIADCGKAGKVTRTFLVVPGPKKPALAVVKQGYSQRPNTSGIGSTVSFGIVFSNPSKDQDAVKVSVLVNFVDAANVVTGSVSTPISVIAAGSTYNLGASLSMPNAIPVAKLEITVTVGASQPKSERYPELANVGIAGAPYDPGWLGEVHGELVNHDALLALGNTRISAVIVDASGNVLGGVSGSSIAAVPPGARILFKATAGAKAIPIDRAAGALVSVEPTWKPVTS